MSANDAAEIEVSTALLELCALAAEREPVQDRADVEVAAERRARADDAEHDHAESGRQGQ